MQKIPRVELIYDADCPNVEAARKNLLRAFARTGLSPRWQEWDRALPESPEQVRKFGSPTILMDGQDVAGESPSEGANCCRIYTDGKGNLTGVPPVEMIASRLQEVRDTPVSSLDSSRWHGVLAAVPAIGTVLLPNLTCPACWPAYAGLLSALGVGFIDYTPYLFPLMFVFLAVALFSLGHRARKRQDYRPFIMGVAAAGVVLVGKFVLASDSPVYGGIVLLIAASIWNSWPRRKRESDSCPACAPTWERR